MKRVNLIFGVILLSLIIVISVYLYVLSYTYFYSSSVYSVEADSAIRHLCINGADISAKFNIFLCEEDYQLQWKTESFVRHAVADSTLFTYSSLFTYDCYKTYIFRPDGFTVTISKCYTQTGFCDNNQIVVDINNKGFTYNETSFTFLGDRWNLTVAMVSSNPPCTIQPPSEGYPSELQFDFNNLTDRDIGFHRLGDIETVTFNVTILKAA